MAKHIFSRRFFLKAASLVFSGLLLGRILGFARETGIASLFGASAESDALIVMLSIPTLLLNLLLSGAMDATLVPEFQKRSEKSCNDLFYKAILFTLIFFSAVAILGYYNTDVLVSLFAPGLKNNQNSWHIAVSGTAICLLILPLTALTAVFQSRLYAVYNFWASSLGTLVFNGALVLMIYSHLEPEEIIIFLPWAAVLGAFLRLLLHMFSFFLEKRKHNNKENHEELINQSNTSSKKLLINYTHALATGIGLMFIPYIVTASVSLIGSGEIAIFNYAIKLAMLPSGIFLSVVATVLFPLLTSLASKIAIQNKSNSDDKKQFDRIVNISFLGLFQSGFLISLGLILISYDLVVVTFFHGNMDHNAINNLAKIATLAFLAIPAQGFTGLTMRIFYAFQDSLRPFLISLLVLAFMLLGCIISAIYFNNLAVMWCYVFSQWLCLAGHIYFLKKKYHLTLFEKILKQKNIICLSIASIVLYLSIIGIKINIISPLWRLLDASIVGGIILLILLKITAEYKTIR